VNTTRAQPGSRCPGRIGKPENAHRWKGGLDKAYPIEYYQSSMNAGTVLKSARIHAGISQRELAQRAGTSQATVSAYEHGHKDPSVATLARLLAATGVTLSVEPLERPVRSPSRAQLREAGKILSQVIDLAAALPTRHDPVLRYPRLGSAHG
jgi:transcriptional regulator with XRE-family HTH domain